MLAPSEFERERTAGYLDTATYGLAPGSTLAALERALADWRGRRHWSAWEADGEACRALFAGLVGAEAATVSLVPALSVAAGIVAASLPAGPGDNVVLYPRDFASALFPWVGLQERGVELRAAPLEGLAEAVDERTALVAVSAVQSGEGRVADLASLRETGARLFVDATQAAGAYPLAVDGIDYLAAHAYKFLLCPRGLAFLYVRPERLEEIEPWLAGWKAHARPYEEFYGLPRELATDARRLDVSIPWLVAAGAQPSLELIASLGVERVAAHDLALARRLTAGLGLPAAESAIVPVAVDDSETAARRLNAAGVACSPRAGAVRLSFHLYNDESDVDLALEALAPLVAGTGGR